MKINHSGGPLSIIAILSLFFAQNMTAQTYCASKGNAPWTEWISNVQFGPLNNASVKEGYGNFTSQIANVAQGQSYPLNITQGFSWAADPTNATQQGRAWIDFNKNGTFEDTEIVANFTRSSVTTSVLIPSTAPLGATRLRISLKTNGLPTACETFDKGEVEDYTVNISSLGGGTNLPDLVLTNLVVPTPSVQIGQILNFNVDFRNVGAGNATGNFTVKSYLSVDQTLSADDYQDGRASRYASWRRNDR
jgi:hypothetical protein